MSAALHRSLLIFFLAAIFFELFYVWHYAPEKLELNYFTAFLIVAMCWLPSFYSRMKSFVAPLITVNKHVFFSLLLGWAVLMIVLFFHCRASAANTEEYNRIAPVHIFVALMFGIYVFSLLFGDKVSGPLGKMMKFGRCSDFDHES